jgi:hypothetical protein
MFFLKKLRKTMETARIPGVPAKIRTENFPNMNEERYRYANPFGVPSLRNTESFHSNKQKT